MQIPEVFRSRVLDPGAAAAHVAQILTIGETRTLPVVAFEPIAALNVLCGLLVQADAIALAAGISTSMPESFGASIELYRGPDLDNWRAVAAGEVRDPRRIGALCAYAAHGVVRSTRIRARGVVGNAEIRDGLPPVFPSTGAPVLALLPVISGTLVRTVAIAAVAWAADAALGRVIEWRIDDVRTAAQLAAYQAQVQGAIATGQTLPTPPAWVEPLASAERRAGWGSLAAAAAAGAIIAGAALSK